jgi:serine/threonine protein kinase
MSSPQLRSEKNYKIEKYLDSGEFGTMFKISINEDQKVYALKQINLMKHEAKDRPAALLHAQTEYEALRKGKPNVLRSYGSFYDSHEQVYRFSTEFMEMNLTQFIEKHGPLHFERFIPIFNDILSGILLIFCYFPYNFLNIGLSGLLHKANSIHRDPRPENILMDAQERAFISDLGVAKFFSSLVSIREFKETNNSSGKSGIWMSPERLESDISTATNIIFPKSEIFSLGLIALYCLDTKNFKHQIKLNEDEEALENYLDQFWLRCPDKRFFYMLKCMLSYSPITRPSIHQLFHDFPEFFGRELHQKQPVKNKNNIFFKNKYYLQLFYSTFGSINFYQSTLRRKDFYKNLKEHNYKLI